MTPQGSGIIIPTPYGLQMTLPPDAKALGDILKTAFPGTSVIINANAPPTILVGQKPPPF